MPSSASDQPNVYVFDVFHLFHYQEDVDCGLALGSDPDRLSRHCHGHTMDRLVDAKAVQ